MAVHPTDAAASGLGVHGLRFLNDEWNDSISNGDSFTLRWNQSLAKLGSGLGVFKVTYPKDGVVVYELISNLTDTIDGDSCQWTPNNLEKKSLYAMWLTAGQDNIHPNWTLSPPWVPKESSGNGASPWAAPFIIPVVCLLGVYAASLTGYLVYRRRKKARREQEDATPHQDASRNNSVDSAVTAQTLSDIEGGPEKRSVVVFANSSSDAEVTLRGAAGSASIDRSEIEQAISNARRGRGGTAEGVGTSSSTIDRSEIERAISNVRRGRSGTAEGGGTSSSPIDRSDMERAQSNVLRGRSGTAERRGPIGASSDRSDIELAQSNFRRGRIDTAERGGIRMVPDSASGSDVTEETYIRHTKAETPVGL
ncbi:hypothetical protein HRG_004300 [Hirsutella rhossiliensis]|uniref:Uncharacterized protein n=1 Tax=Hirsutella rhossiliensis TaxID=111463 RepID=A0A9P8MYX3_9HYPO|nr:uncharacterized protein HRG_04300 [Hirsutella rhossiliensis]KAH0963872.1 hypothetical protein HRG_04300 [Hirsutella rhossiliensis]